MTHDISSTNTPQDSSPEGPEDGYATSPEQGNPTASLTPGQRAAALTIGVLAVLAVAGFVGATVVGAGDDKPASSSTSASSGQQVQTFSVDDQSHVEGPVDYPQMPPVGGPHAAAWQNCGFYPEPIAPENAVHSMEHGAVWIAYRPDLGAEQLEMLRSLVVGNPYVLVAPFAEVDEPVVLSAWTKQLRLATFESPQVMAFVEQFAQGPQTPEPGAPCTGGIGSPS